MRAHWIPHYECSNCGELSSTAKDECPFCHARISCGVFNDLPNVGDYVVFCGTVCRVKAVDNSRRVLTVEYDGHTSYVYAEDVDRFVL
jgi:flavin reductase (DIM6/NTAB) family NADH-FMN oxidoreductase RutF